MPELLTDAQKVMRNDTGIRMAAALEALASGVELPKVIAPEYDATQTYAVGDLVIYRSVLYRCTTAITTPEEWTAAHWTAVTVADELTDKYVKPTGGIPKNDLAASVQESLDKADTAIQLGLTGASVGDLVRVAAVDANGKPTSWNHVPLCDIVTNPNLLDNWYFVGGGSQQGGGQFPINQRGQTSYSNAGYYIDRWLSVASGVGLTINTGDIAITQSSASSWEMIYQKIENYKELAGKTVTLSVYGYREGKTVYASIQNNSNTTYDSFVIGTELQVYSKSMILPSELNNGLMIRLFPSGGSSGTATLHIKAIKLELGSEQTLAHHENGVWVLNEIPDYGQELAKCQRYFLNLSTFERDSGSLQSCIGQVYCYETGVAMIQIPTPVTMAKVPTTIVVNGAVVIIASTTKYKEVSNATPTAITKNSNHIYLTVTCDLVKGDIGYFQSVSGFTISADL